MSGKLKINESLITISDFIHSARTASPDVVLNSLIDLSMQLVRATCLPGTDEETITVLAIYEASKVLERSEVDIEKRIAEAEAEKETIDRLEPLGGLQ
ncbi:hypothetical protein [Desulfocastanea catecholica]